MVADREVDRLTSREIVEALGDMLDRPWPEWAKGRPITERQVAKLLEDFKVHPKVVRIANGTPRSHLLDDLADAFARYLAETSATPQQARETASLSGSLSATSVFDVANRDDRKPAENRQCCGVADAKPQKGREGAL